MSKNSPTKAKSSTSRRDFLKSASADAAGAATLAVPLAAPGTGAPLSAVDPEAQVLELWEQRFATLRAREDASDDEIEASSDTLDNIEETIDALDPSFPCVAAAQLIVDGLFEISDDDRPCDDQRMAMAVKGLAALRGLTRGRIRADVDEILDNPERPVAEMGVRGADTDERRAAVRRGRVERLVTVAQREAERLEGGARDNHLIALGRELMASILAADAIETRGSVAATRAARAASDRKFEAACAAQQVIAERIAEERAFSFAGMRIKACALVCTHSFEAIDLPEDFGATTDVRLLNSIVRDLLKQA